MYDNWRPEDDVHWIDAERIVARGGSCEGCPHLRECKAEGACLLHVREMEDRERGAES